MQSQRRHIHVNFWSSGATKAQEKSNRAPVRTCVDTISSSVARDIGCTGA